MKDSRHEPSTKIEFTKQQSDQLYWILYQRFANQPVTSKLVRETVKDYIKQQKVNKVV